MMDSTSAARRVGRLLFGLALTVYLATAGGSLTSTDAVVTFDVTRSIVEQGSVAMSGNLLGREGDRGRDGRYYAPFGIGQSIYNIPFYIAARITTDVTGLRIGKPDSLPKAFVALGQTFVVAAIVRESYLLAAALLGDLVVAAMAALTLAFASVLWPYSGFGFNQPLACFTLLASTRQAVLGTRRGPLRHVAYAGLWLAASLLTRHEMIAAAAPLAAWLWFDGRAPAAVRARRLAAFAPGLLGGLAIWLIFNAVRFGNPLDTGYLGDPTPGFWSPIAAGLAGLIASPSASVFLYSPVALAGAIGLVWMLRSGDRAVALLFGAVILAFLLFYATLGNWLAGRSYGSRYLVIVLPYFAIGWAVVLAALPRRPRVRAFLVIGTIGLVVQLPGVVIDYAKTSQAVSAVQTSFTTEERQWRWDASPLFLNTRALVRAVPENGAYLLGRRPPPPVAASGDEADRTFSQQFSFSLDLWWLYLYYLHALPRWAVGALLAVFMLAAVELSRRLRLEMRHTG